MVSGDRKLRAACDRCHELKNRCTRTGGPDSRCDRCERLNIDCVYSTTGRMGRPRVSENQKGVTSDSHSHARHSKRRAFQPGKQRGATAVPLPVDPNDPVCTDAAAAAHNISGCASPRSGPDSGRGPGGHGNLEPVFGLPLLFPEVIPGDNLNWNLGINGHAHQEHHQAQNPQNQSKAVSDFSDSGLGTSEQGTASTARITSADELLRLQSHLSNLLTCASESPIGQKPALDKVLMACKELLELLPVPDYRPGSDYSTASNSGTETEVSFAIASVNAGHPDCCHGFGEPTQIGGGPFDPPRINYITVLQVATLYAYALQLLDIAVDNLKTRAGNLAPISLGTFNLASQPAMSTSVGAYMISSMVHQLRDAISLLMPGYQHQKGSPPPHILSPRSGLGAVAAAANNSIQAAVNMVSEKEASLLEKSAQVMTNP
ncbi:Zn(II)2Cys6 transcription factor domain-containing protein [Aspergillus neoniger CBS 115656]|uniref:Zn(2)-C6 fungal-type domain-containing protein n=1 Tax=Aspergillus neoniger (strain CBS 115656) TaxID=1448310 RepID=A0A318ZC27_ASPNB|nr:hypothetical protein BO87DRAFT_422693 [Aspergillus neoniger CBS 115656]PYH37828.1 hypothetical protein BO87DRAFT_422693 [Aspergillus neoniger CBS 115656]